MEDIAQHVELLLSKIISYIEFVLLKLEVSGGPFLNMVMNLFLKKLTI
jgi:hypothetical protein